MAQVLGLLDLYKRQCMFWFVVTLSNYHMKRKSSMLVFSMQVASLGRWRKTGKGDMIFFLDFQGDHLDADI